MISFLGRAGHLLSNVRRLFLTTTVRPLVTGVMLLVLFGSLVPTVSQNLAPQGVVKAHAHTPQKVAASPPLPLPIQTRVRLKQHQSVTVASMTGHTLTTAHLFTHRSSGQLRPKTAPSSKQG